MRIQQASSKGLGYGCANVRGVGRGRRAAVDAGAGGQRGMDHRRVFDAAVCHLAAEAAGSDARAGRGSHAGDPAAGGRALRTVTDIEKLGERTIWIDCDVLHADGGTRTASITGAYVAVMLAMRKLQGEGVLKENPIKCAVAAVSVGLLDGVPLLDLCYEEDSKAAVDMNVVMTDAGEFVEVQGTGEDAPFTQRQMTAMLKLGREGIAELMAAQKKVLGREASGAPRCAVVDGKEGFGSADMGGELLLQILFAGDADHGFLDLPALE